MDNVEILKPLKTCGAVYCAPLGTTMPTDATTALATAFTAVGAISDAGIVESESRDTEGLKAWGGEVAVYDDTSYEKTYKYTMIQMTAAAAKARFGESNVTVDSNGAVTSIKHNSKTIPALAWVFEMKWGENGLKRMCIPNGKITGVEDRSFVDGTIAGFGITLSALGVDEDGNSIDNVSEYDATVTTTSGE